MHALLEKLKAYAFQSAVVRKGESRATFSAAQGSQYAADAREALHNLRTVVLRRESRAANLAYGFLLGRDYWQMERTCYEYPDLQRVENIARQYGAGDTDWNAWLLKAQEYLAFVPPMSTVQNVQNEPQPSVQVTIVGLGVPLSSPLQIEYMRSALIGAIEQAISNGNVNA